MSKNTEMVLEILRDEVHGDVSAALEKLGANYSMTWMYQGAQELFPESKKEIAAELQEVYAIKGRKYEIKNICESEKVVMVELVESYADVETQKVFRTPLVLVLEIDNGEITKGRHYCDPRLSHAGLSTEVLENAYKGSDTEIVIE